MATLVRVPASLAILCRQPPPVIFAVVVQTLAAVADRILAAARLALIQVPV
jgi:hypothetical protein